MMENGRNKNLEEAAYDFFCEISKIPRGSGNERAISDYLAAFAKKNNWEVFQDTSFNVLIRKSGSKGRENEAPLILQAHMDMVCEKNEDTKHDFLKDPIVPYIDGDWVKTKGTTLGADNGSGVAMILAILASSNLSHPPLEMLMTTLEETGCVGAAKFDPSPLKGNRLINLDGAEEGLFVSSCAGGIVTDIAIPVKYENAKAGFSSYNLMIKSLTGGHSACDIDKGRANANILAARLLDKLFDEGIRLVEIKGGAKMNAIPRECTAVISFEENRLDKIKSIAAQTEAAFKANYPSEKELRVTLEKTASSGSVMESDSQKRVINTILGIPCGVQSMSSNIKGLVQTSNNPGVITSSEDKVVLTTFLRSSNYAEMESVSGKITATANEFGAKVQKSEGFPIWEYKADSPLRETMCAVYEEMYGKAPVITGTHGGLECAIFAKNIPNSDLATIGGPDIRDMHSPDERMSLSSFNRTCNFLARVLEKL